MTYDLEGFVPENFTPPKLPDQAHFVLEPLGPQHNERDLEAWTSSIEHIRSTPGFESWKWPPTEGMSLDENLADLEKHADDFAAQRGFTYSVLDRAGGEVIGCVYIYPSRREGFDVDIKSWVRVSRADLDPILHDAISHWIDSSWPWQQPDYSPRSS